jgi:ubiquitin thioesterase OTU1
MDILSKYYQVQIACVSIQNIRMDLFGDSPNRIYLLYDNIHYDIIVRNSSPNTPEASDATIFPSTDSATEAEALALAQNLQEKRQFTDLSGCALMCGVCMQGFKGQKEALKHGNETGHTNFQEVSR